eukprot:CAMPEP_0202379422 /NCGR_PEP_ID=MMETSP1127-20130417/24049_1 /ASSEMBLY_ACC=CAM_ASM_000462 /TAXON_ID=3047 /ORGANISM="Dunaliella tertiolecta, Strain CCMP1320" /LENGTH=55 /DNA_ID=CAMNT_0048977929 /DNA_START=203 /DNA_END=370 /DNA_ORIENTATION=+
MAASSHKSGSSMDALRHGWLACEKYARKEELSSAVSCNTFLSSGGKAQHILSCNR